MFMIKGTYKSGRKETNSLAIGYGNSEVLMFFFFPRKYSEKTYEDS